MKVKWSGIVAVALIVIAITAYKVHTKQERVAGEGFRYSRFGT